MFKKIMVLTSVFVSHSYSMDVRRHFNHTPQEKKDLGRFQNYTFFESDDGICYIHENATVYITYNNIQDACFKNALLSGTKRVVYNDNRKETESNFSFRTK